MNTRQRIIDTSLELFNERGERNVSTNHIAAELQMSPGNLYYHFRNKEDIIRAIYEQYLTHIELTLTQRQSQGSPVDQVVAELHVIFDDIWHFRFFYASLPGILYSDDALHERFLNVQRALKKRAYLRLKTMVDQQVLTIDAADLYSLIRAIKITIVFWISFQMTLSCSNNLRRKALKEGIWQVLFIMRPYFTVPYQQEIDELRADYHIPDEEGFPALNYYL